MLGFHKTSSLALARPLRSAARCDVQVFRAAAVTAGGGGVAEKKRWYGRTTSPADEDAAPAAAAAAEVDSELIKIRNRLAAEDYNRRRAEYRRQVSALRREYAREVSEQREADEAEREALRAEMTRSRLERQRRKNMRSARNAIRQVELAEKRREEFEAHLRSEQIRRDAKRERYRKARQMVIDELEEEAPLWLTTREEIEAAFTPEAEQMLWARRGGVLGAPNPSLDAHFWQYETHTRHVTSTFQSKREALLEDLEETAYEEANVDGSFWTPERVREQEELEERARLRAMVHSAGRSELLRRQRDMLDFAQAGEDRSLPQSKPIPNLGMLENDDAIEREGAKVLMDDPSKFFVFSAGGDDDGASSSSSPSATPDTPDYSGGSRGRPVGLRDPLRGESGAVFPRVLGLIPKPDTRTEKEKKQEERERKMWEAANIPKAGAEPEAVADDDFEDDPSTDIDYNTLIWDPDKEQFRRSDSSGGGGGGDASDKVAGIHEETRAAAAANDDDDGRREVGFSSNSPRRINYSDEDIAWVKEKLEGKINHHKRQFEMDVAEIQSRERTKLQEERDRRRGGEETAGEGGGEPEQTEEDVLHDILLDLPADQLGALADLDDRYVAGTMSPDELKEAMAGIPGLTEKQLETILNRRRDD